ncbi:MAG: hypothetical protein ACOC0X_04110, partial [Halobacteriota archaeon]
MVRSTTTGRRGGRRLGHTPSEVVHRAGPTSLWRYDPATPADAPPLVVVYAVFNRPWILDLAPGRSVVEALTTAGRRVFVLDWGRPTRLDGSLGLADYA